MHNISLRYDVVDLTALLTVIGDIASLCGQAMEEEINR